VSLKRALVLILLVLLIVFIVTQLTGCDFTTNNNEDKEYLLLESEKIEAVIFDVNNLYLEVEMDEWAQAWYNKEGELYDFVYGHKIIGLLYGGSYYCFDSYAKNYYKYDGDVEEAINHTDELDQEIVDNIVRWPLSDRVSVTGTIEIEHNFRDSVVMQNHKSEFNYIEEEKTIDEIIVKIPADKEIEMISSELKNEGYKVLGIITILNRILVEKPESIRLDEVVNVLSSKPYIISAEPNMPIYLSDYRKPTDSRYSEQWGKPTIRLPQTWRDVTGSSNIRVAVMDTGIYNANIELEEFVNRDDGWDFAEDNSDTHDYHFHGTHVAGIVSAKANYHKVSGVMWESELIPIKVFPDDFLGTDVYTIAEALLYSAGFEVDGMQIEPVDIVNMSLGGPDYSVTLHNAVQKVDQESDTIMVSSAGNIPFFFPDRTNITYPAAYDEVIAVGALENRGSDSEPIRASYSSYGPELDVVAPGHNILSTVFENSVDFLSGTSMASPQVAGLVGLMLANSINPDNIRDILHDTAIDLGQSGFDEEYGYGMVNAYWAVNAVDKIHISLGDYSQTVNLDAKEYTFEDIPYGEYTIEAWIDVRGNGIENGDYIFSKEVIIDENTTIDIILEELYQ